MASNDGRGQDSPASRTRLPAVHRRLAQARPPLERAVNQYVETPLRPAPHAPPTPLPPKPDTRPCRDGNFALVTLPVTAAPGKAPGIVCSECNRCRCASCRTPRPMPSTFLCGSTCLCSPASVVDYATCMCLPKACSYHCSDEEGGPKPSWPCLVLSTLLCPCLLCYLPCKGLLRLCEACHRLYTTPGCRCSKLYTQPPPPAIEKRLLDSPE